VRDERQGERRQRHVDLVQARSLRRFRGQRVPILTESKTSSGKRKRFWIDPPYLSVRLLDTTAGIGPCGMLDRKGGAPMWTGPSLSGHSGVMPPLQLEHTVEHVNFVFFSQSDPPLPLRYPFCLLWIPTHFSVNGTPTQALCILLSFCEPLFFFTHAWVHNLCHFHRQSSLLPASSSLLLWA
jgi:hypothetical protein